MLTEKPVGLCPACGEAVFASREEPDGPVWTCPSDLAESNLFYELMPDESWETSEAEKEAMGYFANCPSMWPRKTINGRDFAPSVCPHEYPGGPGHLPLHGACYDRGDY